MDMKPRDFKYFISQGVSGIMSNWLMSLASVSTVIVSLAFLGIFIILGLNLNSIGAQIEEECKINVFVPRDATDSELKAVGAELLKIENVKAVDYYTKEERYRDYKENRYRDDADAIAAFEYDNPLRDACVITLDNPEDAKGVIEAAAKVDGVEEVKSSLDLIDKVISITSFVKTATMWLVIVLLIGAVMIISNTIKLGLFARRKEINIMKFVGATNWFIRWPFIFEGMILGFIGALFSATIVLFAYEKLYPALIGFGGTLRFVSFNEIYNYILWWFIGIGVLIGMVGSYTSIRKHLNV
ncbi:MAG: permease-like cell division protein FtsX [Clostridia bacterium]|nr:permease-like cell division protein FtsX [Clostridia bacterium]